MSRPIFPGATLGVLGSGQLGRMFALAAARMGYHVHCYSPESNSPTGQIADKEFVGSYDDLGAIAKFAQTVDVITFEFENVSSAAGETAAQYVPVHPSPNVLHVCQNRLREKTFLRDTGFPVPSFTIVRSLTELQQAATTIGIPGVLKTAGFGYDGKGQVIIRAASETASAWQQLNTTEAIYEAFVDFQKEVSVIGARSRSGQFTHFGVIENSHTHHILDVSFAPAAVSPALAKEAISIAEGILDALAVVGVLCVEMFITKTGQLLVNELAPRTHNSGHLTIEGFVTSQFEQQVRMMCGLSAGATEIIKPAAMINLLGDVWETGEPNWSALAALSDIKLHLYGKSEARFGRKMGHLTALADTPEQAVQKVVAAKAALLKK